MKATVVFLVLLLSSDHAIADCSAPDLAFERHNGKISGFKIIKLWDESEGRNLDKNHDTLIKFGDYDFLLSAEDRKPVKLNIDTTHISQKLLANFRNSPDYLNSEKLTFRVSDIEAYDLSGDSKENLVLFNVSSGANVYSGAVGIIDGTWKTLIDPTCY